MKNNDRRNFMDNNQIIKQPEESYKVIRNSVLTAQSKVYTAVNSAMVQAYWEIGQEIHKACGEKVITVFVRTINKRVWKRIYSYKLKIYETVLSCFSNSPHTV